MYSVSWSTDGRLASGSWDRTVAVWKPEEREEYVWRQSVGYITALCWSADGRWLAVGTQDRRVFILDSQTGEKAFAYGTNAAILAFYWTPDSKQVWAADNGAGTGRPRVYMLEMVC